MSGCKRDPRERAPTTGPGWELHHGRWQDVLASITAERQVDALITDPPFSARTHASRARRNDGSDAAGSAPTYEPWTPDDVWVFVHDWHPFVRGWMVCITDDILAPAFREAYRDVGRVDFQPVGAAIRGMTCRVRGDGPSSEMLYVMVGRPRGEPWTSWGTMPGVYIGPPSSEASGGRGKPAWLMQSLVRDYSRPGWLVADPMAGWGSTLEAAAALRRRAIGAEQDPNAFAEAERRLRRAVQVDLLAERVDAGSERPTEQLSLLGTGA